jgi:RNA polymerase sigma factor (sigma-70 family)
MGEKTVFVVDDDPAVRDAVSVLVGSAGYRVETFASAEDFLSRRSGTERGCLIADVRMPGLSGLDMQEKLAQGGSLLPVIFITGYGEVPAAVRAMKNGAVDFLQKPFSDSTLLDRVREAIRRSEASRESDEESARIRSRLSGLTDREREILDLVVDGQSTKQIAATLNRAEKTVEFHRTNIMRKLDAPNVAALVRLVMQAHSTGQNGSTPGHA